MRGRTLVGEMLAEFFGTAMILIFGIGVVAQVVMGPGTYQKGQPFYGDNLAISFGWGFGVMLGIYVAGGISGAHLNPAVTLGFALRRGFPWAKVPTYWLAQVAGGFAGALLIYWNDHALFNAFDSGHTFKSAGVFFTSPQANVGLWGGFRDQIILTALLVFLIFAIVDAANNSPLSNLAPLIIGLLIVGIGIAVGINAGWAINPARDLGPRLFGWLGGWPAWRDQAGALYWWVPIVGPLIGGALGAYIYDFGIHQFATPVPEPGQEVQSQVGNDRFVSDIERPDDDPGAQPSRGGAR